MDLMVVYDFMLFISFRKVTDNENIVWESLDSFECLVFSWQLTGDGGREFNSKY